MEPDRYQEIERYLRQEMSPAEQAAFEAQLAQDPALHASLKAEKALVSALRTHTRQRLKDQLQDVEAGLTPLRPRPRWPLYAALAAAAVLLLLWLIRRPAPTSESLYQEFAAHYDSGLLTRAEGTPPGCTAYFEAISHYEDRAYGEAFSRLTALPAADSCGLPAAEWQLLTGVAALQSGETAQALSYLTPLVESQEAARWFVALAQLRQGDEAGLRATLAYWDDRTGYYAQLAQQLRDALP